MVTWGISLRYYQVVVDGKGVAWRKRKSEKVM